MSCIKGPHKKMLKTVLLQGWHSAFKGPNKKTNYCIHYAQNSFTRGLQEAFRLPAHHSRLEQPAQGHGYNSHPPVLIVQMTAPPHPTHFLKCCCCCLLHTPYSDSLQKLTLVPLWKKNGMGMQLSW